LQCGGLGNLNVGAVLRAMVPQTLNVSFVSRSLLFVYGGIRSLQMIVQGAAHLISDEV
jgi:hypothetical protein